MTNVAVQTMNWNELNIQVEAQRSTRRQYNCHRILSKTSVPILYQLAEHCIWYQNSDIDDANLREWFALLQMRS